jgi:hypothetical protein
MFQPFLGHHQGDNRYTKCIKHLHKSSFNNAARAHVVACSTCIALSIKTWGIKKANSIHFKHILQFLQSYFVNAVPLSMSYNTCRLTVFMWSNCIPFTALTSFSPNFLPLIPQVSCKAYMAPHPNIWLLTRFYRVGPMSTKHGNHLYLTTQTCQAMQVHSSCQGQ